MSGLRAIVREYPVLAATLPTLVFAWAAFLGLIALRLDPTPAILALSAFFILMQVMVNWLIGGWPEVRRAFGRLLRVRFGPFAWLLVVAGAPLATLAVAAATGTLQSPAGGWGPMVLDYLLATFVIGALLVNLWEESLWGGFVQARLMGRHGLLIGSLLSAIPFALIHMPLAFGPPLFFATPPERVALLWAVMIGSAPFFRYLMGMMFLETGGSTLALGIMHASWNASSSLPAASGNWQYIAALPLLILIVAVWRRLHGHSPITGRPAQDRQTAAAA